MAPALLRAGLTVEASVVLPVFLVCMMAVMQLMNVYENADRLAGALTETAEEMAVSAYITSDAGKGSKGADAAGKVLTTAYGSSTVRKRAGDLGALKSVHFALSALQTKRETICLSCSYKPKPAAGMVQVPWISFLQQAQARAWVGRGGSDGKESDEDGEKTESTVYVTEHGKVYHKDRNCTHIHLSIRMVSKQQALVLRNKYGARYKPCEHCGKRAGSSVYITTDGDRYHSSRQCSGLKRTVREMKESEVQGMRACSRCGGT